MENLRGEISTLRDQLNQQVRLFTEERQRWEDEINGMMRNSIDERVRLFYQLLSI